MTPVRLSIAVAAAAILTATTASAADGEQSSRAYVAVSAGSGLAGTAKIDARSSSASAGSIDEDIKAGGFVSVAVGTKLGKGFDLEGELLYLKNDVDTKDLDAVAGGPLNASLQATGVMANAHYSFAPIGAATFRVGAGAGYGQTKYEILGGSDDKSGAMWQISAGLAYAVTDRTSWTAEYRYLGVPDYDASSILGGATSSLKIESRVHVLAVGLRANF